MKKLLKCPCTNVKYCGTMISSMKLHNLMYNNKFREFIHSHEGLKHLLSNYDGKTEIVTAIKDTYFKLR